jgi:hypothetical protein
MQRVKHDINEIATKIREIIEHRQRPKTKCMDNTIFEEVSLLIK